MIATEVAATDNHLTEFLAHRARLTEEQTRLEQRRAKALEDLTEARARASIDEKVRSCLSAKHTTIEKLDRQLEDVAGMLAAVDVAIKEAESEQKRAQEAEKWRRIYERAAVLEARRADIVECVRELEARYDAAAEVYREVLQLGGSPRALGDIVIFGLSLAQLMGSSGWEMNRFG